MNTKHLAVAAAVVLAAGASFASVTTTNKICRIKVTSAETNTIVALPLVNIGVPYQTTLNATNYVQTVGLDTGTILYQNTTNENGVFVQNGWYLLNGTWVAPSQSSGGITTPALETAEYERGPANVLRLFRPDPGTGGAPRSFYLVGQVPPSGSTVTFSPASKYQTLVGNPMPSELDITSIGFTEGKGPSDGDYIVVPSRGETHYTWHEGNWCTYVRQRNGRTITYVWTPVAANAVTVAPGSGFWYYSSVDAAPELTFTMP